MPLSFWELGREKELAFAEIKAVLQKDGVNFREQALAGHGLIINTDVPLPYRDLMLKMGGTVRLGAVQADFRNLGDIKGKLSLKLTPDQLFNHYLKNEHKINFGFSLYFDQSFNKTQRNDLSAWLFKHALTLKKEIRRETERKVRVVKARNRETLSSVVVTKNDLIAKGAEINVILTRKRVYLARTEAVQPFEEYRIRDIKRPRRSLKVGMMPPKLAQVIINLAQVKEGGTIYDPFCGLGTVLGEAMLMGYGIYGSDHNPAMVSASQENLAWLGAKNIKSKIFLASAQNVSSFLRHGLIDAVVSEGDLGPIYYKTPAMPVIRQNFRELKNLYRGALAEWRKILEPQDRVVLTLPYYQKTANQAVLAPFIDIITGLGYTLLKTLEPKELKRLNLALSTRDTLLYARPGQKVGREILILSKD
jgi:tRNA G10  N-methylase Trm11